MKVSLSYQIPRTPPAASRTRAAFQFGRGKAKTIFAGGKGFCFASALFVGGGAFRRARQGAGGMRGGFLSFGERFISNINFVKMVMIYEPR
jgi:hypothetical protein